MFIFIFYNKVVFFCMWLSFVIFLWDVETSFQMSRAELYKTSFQISHVLAISSYLFIFSKKKKKHDF